MNYQRIVLHGYIRLRLNTIEHFEMKIESPLQLFLGTNGSGKSSLLWELSPLPPNKDDFMPGGYKIIEITHRGHYYVIGFTLTDKPRYSFVCDNEELNEGATITVQKELVKAHFKITQDIQEILSGQDKLSTMGAPRRKDWFLRLCDVNYDYALQTFAKLKNAHRDRSGAIRLERRALVVESQKLLSEQEVVRLNDESHKLHEALNVLLEQRKPVEHDRTVLEMQDQQLDRQLLNLSRQFEELHQRINDREHSDAELVDLIEEYAARLVQAQTRATMLAEQFDTVNRKLNVLKTTGDNTIGGLELQVAEVQTLLTTSAAALLLGRSIDQPEQAQASFESVYLALMDVFNEIPINTDKRYSLEALNKAREDLNAQLMLKNNLLEKMAERKANITHMQEHLGKPDVTCPKCSHSFSMIYSEERVHAIAEEVRQIEDRLFTEVYSKITELEAFIAECSTYGQKYRQFVQFTQSTPLLNPYWYWLQERRIISENPRQGVMDLEAIRRDLTRQVELAYLHTRKREVTMQLEMLKSVGEADVAQLQSEAAIYEEQLNGQTHELQLAQAQHQHYKSQFDLRRQAGTIRRNLRKAIRLKRQNYLDTVETDRRGILNQLIRDLQSALASREHSLHAAQRQRDIVEGMTRKIEQLVLEEEALAILVKELSPTEGLIAEGMLGFIKNFCDQMNRLMDQIWTYPLEIQSCELVEGESIDLDYKFPLIQGTERRKVKDVAQGSEGMREMVDLAFRMTAMQYLDLQETPLYLDETGRAFDEAHRSAMANMVRSLIEQHTFPQVFMISHYHGVYGALANAQICVLDPSNILVPKTYNEHVVMS